MAGSATTWLAAGAAFAAGVAATVAVMTPDPGQAPIASRPTQAEAGSQAEKAAAREEKPVSAARAWSDPVKPPGPVAPTAERPPSRLVFRAEATDEPSRTDQPRSAGATDEHRARGDQDGPGVRAEHARAARRRSEQARAERARSAMPRASEPDDASAEPGRTGMAARPTGPAEHVPPRRQAATGLAARSAGDDRPSLAADKQARSVVVRPSAHHLAEARRPDERARPRVPSAGASGVMAWLAEP